MFMMPLGNLQQQFKQAGYSVADQNFHPTSKGERRLQSRAVNRVKSGMHGFAFHTPFFPFLSHLVNPARGINIGASTKNHGW